MVNDSHAEVIARRALQAWIYGQMELALAASDDPSKPRSIFHFIQTAGKFKLRPDVQLHMYISQPPCGDGSIISDHASCQHDTADHQTAGHSPSPAAGQDAGDARQPPAPSSAAAASSSAPASAAAGMRTGAKAVSAAMQQDGSLMAAVPQASDVEAGQQQVGLLRRKPGKGDPTLSMCCSDKLARWGCLGLQGGLLSALLEEPLYLSSITVALPPGDAAAGVQQQQQQEQEDSACCAPDAAAVQQQHSKLDGSMKEPSPSTLEAARVALYRAVAGRIQHLQHLLQPPFRWSAPQACVVQQPPPELGLGPSDMRKVASGAAVNWSAGALVLGGGKPAAVAAGTHEVTLGADGRKAGQWVAGACCM